VKLTLYSAAVVGAAVGTAVAGVAVEGTSVAIGALPPAFSEVGCTVAGTPATVGWAVFGAAVLGASGGTVLGAGACVAGTVGFAVAGTGGTVLGAGACVAGTVGFAVAGTGGTVLGATVSGACVGSYKACQRCIM
jgi:hypothetical protein